MPLQSTAKKYNPLIPSIELNPGIWPLGRLFKEVDSKKVSIPQFQRGLIWKEPQKLSLLESIRQGYPIGSLLMHEQGDSYTIIDGLQRTSTIAEFMRTPAMYTPADVLEIAGIEEVAGICKVPGDKLVKLMSDLLRKQPVDVLKGHTSPLEFTNQIAQAVKLKLDKESSDKLQKYISDLLDQLCRFYDSVLEYNIPVLVMSGPMEHLPEIFKRINASGTKLTKYQIYAAVWERFKVIIDALATGAGTDWKNVIMRNVRERYESWRGEGFELNFDIDQIAGGQLTLFEFLLGFGSCLREKYPFVIGGSDEPDPTIGFLSLFAFYSQSAKTVMGGDFIEAVLTHAKVAMDKDLPKVWNDNAAAISNDLQDAASRLYEAYGIVQEAIGFLQNVNITKVGYSHPQYLIATIGAWLARHPPPKKKTPKEMISRIRQRYVHDMLQNKWRGTGDKQLFEAISEVNYLRDLPQKEWGYLWGLANEEEGKAVDKRREQLTRNQQLLLRLAYSQIQKIIDAKTGPVSFQDDHVFPVAKLKELFAAGGPINHTGNRSLVPIDLHEKKLDSLPHEFLATAAGAGMTDDLRKYWALDDASLWTLLSDTSQKIGKALKTKATEHIRLATETYSSFVSERYKKITAMVENALE